MENGVKKTGPIDSIESEVVNANDEHAGASGSNNTTNTPGVGSVEFDQGILPTRTNHQVTDDESIINLEDDGSHDEI